MWQVKTANALVAAAICVSCQACSGAQQSAVVQPAVDLTICVLTNVGQCIVNKTPWLPCTESVAATCGVDVASVVSIWGAHRAAESREGLAPPPATDGGIP